MKCLKVNRSHEIKHFTDYTHVNIYVLVLEDLYFLLLAIVLALAGLDYLSYEDLYNE